MRKYQREWIKNRRLSFLDGKKCIKCGSTQDLEFDHIDPSSKFTHRIWSHRRERIEEELKKCQILCKKCHQEKTNEENGFGPKHGTAHTYNYYGCRCRSCTDDAVKKVNEWRIRTGRRGKKSPVAQQ